MVLEALIRSVGYAGVAGIVFAENGLLIGFFLPGDSLLFTAGFLASQGVFDIWVLTIALVLASIFGVSVGYEFGKRYGRKLFHRPDSRFFKKENLERAQVFYEKHGPVTIVLARFIPIVRTFAPIVAGIANMNFGKFLLYNIIGGVLWGGGLTLLGYWLGGSVKGIDKFIIPVLFIIIILSILPGIVHMLKEPERRRNAWEFVRGMFRR